MKQVLHLIISFVFYASLRLAWQLLPLSNSTAPLVGFLVGSALLTMVFVDGRNWSSMHQNTLERTLEASWALQLSWKYGSGWAQIRMQTVRIHQMHYKYLICVNISDPTLQPFSSRRVTTWRRCARIEEEKMLAVSGCLRRAALLARVSSS